MKPHESSGKRRVNRHAGSVRVVATAALASVVVMFATASVLTPAAGSRHSKESPSGTVLFSLAVGREISYSGTGPEQQTWGPNALVVDDESVVWLADGAAHRVLGFDMDGGLRHEISLADSVVGIGGIVATKRALLVLDIADQEPKIAVVDKQTKKVAQVLYLPSTASLQNGLTGLSVDTDGNILAELEFGLGHVNVGRLGSATLVEPGEDALFTKSTEKLTAAGALEILPSLHADNPSRSTVRVGGVDVHVDFVNLAGTTQFVGATSDRIYFAFDEVSQDADGRVLVDSTLRVFDRSATELGVVRVPHSDGVSVPRILADLSPSGDAIVAVGHADRLDIVRLEFDSPSILSPVLPRLAGEEQLTQLSGLDPGGAGVGVLAASLPCVSRSQMSAVDSSYRTSSRTLSSTNISGTCTGRTKPRYLGSAGTYTSVPYDWGGFDSVSTFNAQMSPGTGKAGNINSSTQPSCAYGVDCSGFVSRVWRQSSKYGTSTLPNISNTVALSSRKEFDIFNKSGSHVVLYRSTSGNNYYVSEATTSSSLDRVVYRAVATSYVNGYTLRRYANVSNHPSELQCSV